MPPGHDSKAYTSDTELSDRLALQLLLSLTALRCCFTYDSRAQGMQKMG
jgi:hypothetical protein